MVVGKDQERVEEASDGKDLESLEPESVLQPCQMVVPEGRQREEEGMPIGGKAVGYRELEDATEDKRERRSTAAAAAADMLTRDVSMKDAIGLMSSAVSDAVKIDWSAKRSRHENMWRSKTKIFPGEVIRERRGRSSEMCKDLRRSRDRDGRR